MEAGEQQSPISIRREATRAGDAIVEVETGRGVGGGGAERRSATLAVPCDGCAGQYVGQ